MISLLTKPSRLLIIILPLLLLACQEQEESPTPRSSSSSNNTSPPPSSNSETTFIESNRSHPLANSNQSSMDAKVVDIDQDGDLDIVIAVEFLANRLLINDGNGGFSFGTFPTEQFDSEDIAIADFNDDARLDVVFVSEDDFDNELYLQNENGSFTVASSRIPVKGKSNAVVTFDANADDLPDLLIGNDGQNQLLINDGSGSFTVETAARLPIINDITQDLEIGDIDNDGDLDILVGNEDDNRLLINNGSGIFTDETSTRLPLMVGEETREADFGDIDGDGDLDIAFGNVIMMVGTNDQNRLLVNDGTGIFTDETNTRLPIESSPTIDIDFIDYDNDGDLDLITANFGGYDTYENDGEGNFTKSTQGILPKNGELGNGIDIEFADFNGDNINDLYLANFQGGDVILFHK